MGIEVVLEPGASIEGSEEGICNGSALGATDSRTRDRHLHRLQSQASVPKLDNESHSQSGLCFSAITEALLLRYQARFPLGATESIYWEGDSWNMSGHSLSDGSTPRSRKK